MHRFFIFWGTKVVKVKDFAKKISVFLLFLASFTFSFFSSCSNLSDSQVSQERLFTQTGDEEYVSAYQVEASASENQSKNLSKDWYKHSSFYYIWINDFYDSNDDGYGDFAGITQKLDYIKETVGCDAILISPFFDCESEPSDNYFSYDTIDFYSVNSKFGTEYDLENLIQTAHQKGMKIIFDFAPNATSKNHPWFVASMMGNRSVLSNLVASSSENLENAQAKKAWYLWSDDELSWDNGISKNTWYNYDKSYYYSAFSKDLPDLNFYNVEVRLEIKNVIRYWLNKGFDGLRIDSVRYLIEENNSYVDTEKTHEFISEIRTMIDEYSSKKFLVADTKIKNNRNLLELYFGTHQIPEFNMLFDYDAILTVIKSVLSGRDFTAGTLTVKEPFVSASFANYLGATDDYFNRIGYIFKDDVVKTNQTIALNVLRTSVPFVYFGNELALDKGEFDWKKVEKQENSSNSTLLLTQNLLKLRKSCSAFVEGIVSKLSSTDGENKVLAYVISNSKNSFVCVFNFSEEKVDEISFYQNKMFNENDSFYSLICSDQEESIAISEEEISFANLLPNSFKLYSVNDDSYAKNFSFNFGLEDETIDFEGSSVSDENAEEVVSATQNAAETVSTETGSENL